jgi:two-component system phosphate regulon sensor histidine kinase PhoR
MKGPVIVRGGIAAEQYLSLQIVPYGAGQLLMLVRDVTREARLEAMRKDFVANASHELRSPLTVISGYLETLAQDTEIDPMLLGPLQEMRRQALRMTGIVQDLLELSRLESSDTDAPRASPSMWSH